MFGTSTFLRRYFKRKTMNGSPTFGVGQSVSQRMGVVGKLIAKQVADNKLSHFVLLEVGSYEGGSALAFSSFIAEHCEHGGQIVCVDTWAPYLPQEDIDSNDTCARMQDALASGDVFKRFCDNIKFANKKAPIGFHMGTLPNIAPFIGPDEQFDMIYIDGSHAYQDVRNDIRVAKPLLKIGGIMCGDDLERQFPDTEPEVTHRYKHREFVNEYHPGVTLAVWKAFGKVWCEEAVWAVRKLDRMDKNWSAP